MTQIEVQPAVLEQDANTLRDLSRRIKALVADVDNAVLVKMGPSVFEGNRPDQLRNRYRTMQPQIEAFGNLIDNFAQKLDQIAADFRQADRT
jgi:WXG100 family type VII secretion target